MYIDCEVCGFESKCFCPLGKDFSQQLIDAIVGEGCDYSKNSNGSFNVKCPSGHEASLLPTEAKFRKRYKMC